MNALPNPSPRNTDPTNQLVSRPRIPKGLLIAGASVMLSIIAANTAADQFGDETADTTTQEPEADSPIEAPETALPIQIDCSDTSYELPTILEAKVAKEAVSNIEFFIDDPDQVDHIKRSVFAAESHEEAEQIVNSIFTSRGIDLLFQAAPGGIQFDQERPELTTYQRQLSNMVEAYSRIPANLAGLGTELYVASNIRTPKDTDRNGKIDEYRGADGVSFGGGVVVYNLQAFGGLSWGLNVINHELDHELDGLLCAADDPAYTSLADQSSHTSPYKGHEPDDYSIAMEATDGSGRQVSEVVARAYGLASMAEDKSTAKEPLVVGDFPDESDPGFNPESLIYQKTEIVVGRQAEAIGIPQLAQYYAFIDLYGHQMHPKRITNYDFSAFQSRQFAEIADSFSVNPTGPTFNEGMDNFGVVVAKMPDGSSETLYYFRHPESDYVDLLLSTPPPAMSEGFCEDSSLVQDLEDLAKRIIDGIGLPGAESDVLIHNVHDGCEVEAISTIRESSSLGPALPPVTADPGNEKTEGGAIDPPEGTLPPEDEKSEARTTDTTIPVNTLPPETIVPEAKD